MSQQTIELISESFDLHNIKYRTIEAENLSFIDAGFNIAGGPTVHFHFLSANENSNDVQIRVVGLLNKVGAEKRPAILEACNRINKEMRYYKFYIDNEDNVIAQADVPQNTLPDCIGECCFELLARAMQILERCYHYFPEAYYAASPSAKSESLLNALKELRNNPITLPENDGTIDRKNEE